MKKLKDMTMIELLRHSTIETVALFIDQPDDRDFLEINEITEDSEESMVMQFLKLPTYILKREYDSLYFPEFADCQEQLTEDGALESCSDEEIAELLDDYKGCSNRCNWCAYANDCVDKYCYDGIVEYLEENF